MSDEVTGIGIVGCGKISSVYFRTLGNFDTLKVVACADLDPSRAEAQAKEFGIPKACSVDELLADPVIDLVVNLTVPQAHATVGLAALEAGKHHYSEKPLAIDRNQGRRLLELAKEKGLRVGCAPDTFLGAGLQTCRKLIDDGVIGEPVSATAFLLNHGMEHWHPDPDFFYQPGGGPMFDMGPYYLTALVNMMGPVRRVTGSTRATFPERVISSEPKRGQVIKVNTPTHLACVMDFRSGAIATLVTSNDVWKAQVPRIEIYGTTGTLSAPDPNTFGGPVRVWTQEEQEWREVPLIHEHAVNSRGIGVADFVQAIQENRPARASGELAYHVLDIMHAVHDASSQSTHIEMTSTCERPAPLPEEVLRQ